MVMIIMLRSNILHLVHGATLRATLNRALTVELFIFLAIIPPKPSSPSQKKKTYAEPVSTMRIRRESSASRKLLLTRTPHHNRIRHRTQPARIQRAHVENIDALHLTQNLKTLQTSGLFKIGGNGARLGAGAEKVFLAADLCQMISPCILKPLLYDVCMVGGSSYR